MKFQLFGRLRDGDDGDTGSNNAAGGPSGPADVGGGDSGPGLGGGLERTVENMFSQGYSEDEIKQELQGQYSPNRIEQAVNQAVATSAQGETEGPEPMTPYQEEEDAVSPVDEGFNQDGPSPAGNDNDAGGPPPATPADNMDDNMQQQQPPPQQPPAQGSPSPQRPQGRGNTVDPEVEELVETIVAESFDRVEVEFENVYDEIDELKEKAEDLEERVHDLEVRDDEDQEQFIQKMNEMEDHIDSYQSRIGGLEKAFQQVLPSLVDNVRDLTELVQEIKQERGIETDKNVSSQDIDDLDVEDWD